MGEVFIYGYNLFDMPAENLLFLYGNDEYAIARRLEEIQQRYDKDGINTARLEARLASDEELNNAVNAIPFLGEERLVFISNPSSRSSDPAMRNKFIDFLLCAPASTRVVIHELIETRDLNKHWLVRRAEKRDFKAESFFQPRQKEMTGWIIDETRRLKGQIERNAAARLAEMVGEDTRFASQEITKLLTYNEYSRPISIVDVEAVSIVNTGGDVFALVDALGAGNGRKAQQLLHQQLEIEDAAALWGMVIRQFRLLLQAREIIDGNGNSNLVRQMLGLHEFVAGKISEQARRFSLSSLESIYHRLLDMDTAAKTSQVPLDLALDLLIADLSQ